jgi:NADPH:quinone reductase-like Zn-dependent oxidoreductase
MASILLNESNKGSPDAIERALAHKDKDVVHAAYHRGARWWADYLDGLRAGGRVVLFKAPANGSNTQCFAPAAQPT